LLVQVLQKEEQEERGEKSRVPTSAGNVKSSISSLITCTQPRGRKLKRRERHETIVVRSESGYCLVALIGKKVSAAGAYET